MDKAMRDKVKKNEDSSAELAELDIGRDIRDSVKEHYGDIANKLQQGGGSCCCGPVMSAKRAKCMGWT
jgi:hypothetical protein